MLWRQPLQLLSLLYISMIIGIGGVALTKSRGGAAFDPKVLSGLQLWLKADTGVLDASDNPITVDSTGVKTWQDQSGNNRHATQATSASRPIWRSSANGLNGLPGIENDTTAKFLGATANLFTTSVTLFAVIKFADSTTRYCALDLKGTYPNHFAIEQNTYNGTNKNGFTAGSSNLSTSGASSTNGQVFTIAATTGTGTTPIIANTNYRVNSVTQTLTLTGGGGNFINYTAVNGYTLGSFSTGNILGMKGKLFEVVVYNRVLTGTEITQVETYLKSKWGL